MLPAWVTKLRDVKAGSRAQKQQKKPLLSPSPSGKRRNEDPGSFAKALSLQRANSRARNSRFEAEIGHACKDLDPKHYDVKSTIDTFDWGKLRSYGDAELREEADSLIIQRRDLGPWGCDSSSLSSCGIEPDPLSVKDIRFSAPSVQKGHGVSDNDTEDFALTPDTPDSSFCSETSSADSAVSCKCRCEEEGQQHQHQQPWKERNSPNVARNPSITCSKLQGRNSSCSAASGNASMISTSKWQERSIQLDAAENSSLLLSTKWQESVSTAAGNPSLISRLCPEKSRSAESPSLMSSTWQGRSSLSSAENSSLISSRWEVRSRAAENASLMARSRKQKSNDAAENATFISSKWQERTRSPPETPSSMPSRWEERSSSDGAENPNFSCSKWQEKLSNLNAAENPSLTSSKWQPSSSSSLAENPSLVWRNWQEGSSSSCAGNSSLVCSKWQENSSIGSPNSKHEPSLRRRRRHSRSSISAVLPADLQGVVGDSIALVKMSHNPYEDFRQSMYEMIMEKDLEESINVEELLSCYLTLNSPEHHELIEEVFSDVWSAILMTLR